MLDMVETCQTLFTSLKVPVFLAYHTLEGVDSSHDTLELMSLRTHATEINTLRPRFEAKSYILRYNRELESESFTLVSSDENANSITVYLLEEKYGGWVEPCRQWYATAATLFPLRSVPFYHLQCWVPQGTATNFPLTTAPALLRHFASERVDNDYGIAKCLIINDIRRCDRWHKCILECQKQGLVAERVEAVLGRTLERHQLVTENLLTESPDRPLRLNEIAVILSHVAAWRQVSTLPEGSKVLVMEDDLEFRPSFGTVMRRVRDRISNWDLVFLGYRLVSGKDFQTCGDNLALTGSGYYAHAYIVTPHTARQLLTRIFPIRRPLDWVITFASPPFAQATNFDSRFQDLLTKVNVVEDLRVRDRGCIGIVDQRSYRDNDSTTAQDLNSTPVSLTTQPTVSELTRHSIKHMLNDVDLLLTRTQLPYLIFGGTQLGAIRHHDVISWDDDADISIFESDNLRFQALAPELGSLGYVLQPVRYGYKIHRRAEVYPFIDVFVLRDFGDRYHFWDEASRRYWPQEYVRKTDLFPLRRYRVGQFFLTGANQVIEYLYRGYGRNWRTSASLWWDHKLEKRIPTIYFPVAERVT
jgi:GR25 family glycosyltransferase involved in LPS biosynthesis